jgi:hypothetical protein
VKAEKAELEKALAEEIVNKVFLEKALAKEKADNALAQKNLERTVLILKLKDSSIADICHITGLSKAKVKQILS